MLNWILEYKHLDTWYAINNNKYIDYRPDFHVNKTYLPELDDILTDIQKNYEKHPLNKKIMKIPRNMENNEAFFSHLQFIAKKGIPEDSSEFTREFIKADQKYTTFKGFFTAKQFDDMNNNIPEEYHSWSFIIKKILMEKTYNIIPPFYIDPNQSPFITEVMFYFGSKSINFESAHQLTDYETKRKKLKEIEKEIFPIQSKINSENWRCIIYDD